METNPYAIRLELIKLAKEMEFDTFNYKRDKIHMLYSDYQDKVSRSLSPALESTLPPFDFSMFDSLKTPDADRINEVADKLYEFVSKKK